MDLIKKKKFYAIINLIATILPILDLVLNNDKGKQITDAPINIDTYFSPAGYTFSIWFVIYIALLIFAVHQIKVAFGKAKNEDTLFQIGPFLIFSLAFNSLWNYVWLQGNIALATAFLFASFFCLLAIIVRLKMQTTEATMSIRKYTWIPISLYAGWMMAACVVGFSTYLKYLGFGEGKYEEVWAAVMVVIVASIYYYMLSFRNMVIYTLVGAWALIGIAVKQWDSVNYMQWVALFSAIVLILMSIIQLKNKPNYTVSGIGKN